MERILPGSFAELLAGVLLIAALIVVIVSLFQAQKKPVMRLSAMVLFVASLCLFSDNGWVYLVGVIIIALAITDLELIQNIVAIIRQQSHGIQQHRVQAPATNIVQTAQTPQTTQTAVHYHPQKPQDKKVPKLQALEKEILHMLWTQQQNKWPDMSTLYTMRIDPTDSDYQELLNAGKKLHAEQLVGITNSGDYYLTQLGYDYCTKYSYTFTVH